MNVNMLTIDSNLAAVTEANPFPSKSDLNTKDARFARALDDEKPQVKTPEEPATDNIKETVQNHEKPISNRGEELPQSIDKKIKSEDSCKDNNNKTNSKERNAIPDSAKQQSMRPNVVHSLLAEHSIVVNQNKEDAPTKNEAKRSANLAQIITNAQNKSSSVTGHAVKSAEIKLLHTAEKGQLGIKTILPAKSNGQNGLKAITPGPSKNIPAAKKQSETAINNEKVAVSAKTIRLTEKVNTRELAPEISANSGKITNAPGVKPSLTNINLTTVQDKTSETKPHSRQVEPEKLKLTADTDAKSKKSQNISNLSNPNSKQSIPAGNNISESKSAQKLNAASVQVITNQTKDQSNSASNKSPSQGFEQIFSHNNSQTLITEQTPVPAKNTATANLQNQSQNNVSADIGRQIFESVQSSMPRQGTDHQITVRLNPPELGKVLIRFQQQENELTGLMEVNKTQTRLEIEQALPQLIRNLADCGIHIRRLEVMLSNDQQPGQGALGNQSLQNGGAQQQYSANQGPSGNDSPSSQSNEWLSSNNSYENLSELQETPIAGGSINLLV
jgi:flagellar hook-length control protein FliK